MKDSENGKVEFIPLREVARRHNFSKPTVSRLIAAKKIPHIRIGSWPLIPADWIEAQLTAAAESVNEARNPAKEIRHA
jgi:excisionase family DNA binding protein